MIETRSPLRISLGGGGTDLPSYYRQHRGFLVAATIDKYVYLSLLRPFVDSIILKYSKIEKVADVSKIEHPIIRETLTAVGFGQEGIEISALADIPAGTGLGSSGSFTTALIKALATLQRRAWTQRDIAELACDIEIHRLNQPIGKQDAYVAAYGGLNSFTFNEDESVIVEPLQMDNEKILDLEDNLLLFFTGFSRQAANVLKDQVDRTKNNDPEVLKNLHYTKELGYRSRDALVDGDIINFGRLMHTHWLNKLNRSTGMSNQKINDWYSVAMKNGAIGGKLVGAGGGGFLLLLASDKRKLRNAMSEEGLREVKFQFDFEGTKVMVAR